MPNGWFRYPILYFLITAAAGVVLRGMAFLPAWQVKYEPLLHAHSHLALLGWGYTALMLLLVSRFILPDDQSSPFLRINWLLTQLTIAGMFIAFYVQGYGLFSILFSTVHIFLSYSLAVWMWRKLRSTRDTGISVRFAKASLLFMVLSSLGPWSLAFLSAKHLTESPWYHAALYFYLHCQYNGWFTLGLFALLYSLLEQKKVSLPAKLTSWHYRGYTITLLPTFILSLLWMKLSAVWTVIAVVSGLVQCVAVGAFFLLWFGKRRFSSLGLFRWPHIFLNSALAALFLKMLLELGSAIPVLEPLVFATRNIVIGYLHLVLLGFVSFMLLALLLQMNLLKVRGKSLQVASLFIIVGFILNEAALFLDGLLDWTLSSGFPYRSMWLLTASLLMFIGIGIICYWQYSKHTQTS